MSTPRKRSGKGKGTSKPAPAPAAGGALREESFLPPAAVIRIVGEKQLEEIIVVALRKCASCHLGRVIRKADEDGRQKGQWSSQEGMAAFLGVDTTKLKRMRSGKLKRATGIEGLDLLVCLIKLGCFDQIRPPDETANLALLNAVLSCTRQVRQGLGEAITGTELNEDDLRQINQLAQGWELPELSVLDDSTMWSAWWPEQVHALKGCGSLPAFSPASGNGRPSGDLSAFVILAADWLAARRYLPGKLTALRAVIDHLSETEGPSTRPEGDGVAAPHWSRQDQNFVMTLFKLAQLREEGAFHSGDMAALNTIHHFVEQLQDVRKWQDAFLRRAGSPMDGANGVARQMELSPEAAYEKLEMIGLTPLDFHEAGADFGKLITKSKTLGPLAEKILDSRDLRAPLDPEGGRAG